MFFKLSVVLIISLTTLFADNQNVEVLAQSVTKVKNIIHAKDDVVLYSDKYIITADEAYYDNNTSDVELIGDITILQGTDFSTRSGYAKINLKSDSGNLSPMFAYMGESQLWLKCDDAVFDDKYYMTRQSFISSCNVQDPAWKIGFSSGQYDRQTKFMSMYNTLFYAGDIPIFYLPYFSFPTDKTRRTGLLRPKYGYGSEGLFYQQGIYFAPQKNWDFQLDPQIRTSRGYGVHGKLRFVDSAYSNGMVTLGKFWENSSYMKEENLKSDEHYGYGITYDRSKLLSDYFGKDTKDGLWIDFQYLNDIDYLNTVDNSDTEYTDKLVESRLNYFLKRDLDYFGLYARYYIDTAKVSNDDTLQELPTVHYHRFTNSILLDNVFYSADYKSTNYTRSEGSNAISHEINAPISIYFPLFNELLHFKMSENFHISKVSYDNEVVDTQSGVFIQNFHRFSLYTDMSKSYDDFFHTIYFGADYTLPGTSSQKGIFQDYVPISKEEESLSLDLVEYFYDKSGKKVLSHAMRQAMYFSDYKYKYGDLENDLKYYYSKDISITNLLNYSHEYSRISKFQTALGLTLDEYKISFLHTYGEDENDVKTNYLTFSTSTNYIQNYNFFASTNYDIEKDYFKSWQVGVNMKRKCWNYALTYREEVEPDSSTDGSTQKQGIYLVFNLVPIGGLNYNFIEENAFGGLE